MFRLIAGVFLGLWLAAAFAFTLREAHPLAGQVVNDNPTPFVTIRIYLDNLDSAFWLSQGIGNLLLLLPLGLLRADCAALAEPMVAASCWWRWCCRPPSRPPSSGSRNAPPTWTT